MDEPFVLYLDRMQICLVHFIVYTMVMIKVE